MGSITVSSEPKGMLGVEVEKLSSRLCSLRCIEPFGLLPRLRQRAFGRFLKGDSEGLRDKIDKAFKHRVEAPGFVYQDFIRRKLRFQSLLGTKKPRPGRAGFLRYWVAAAGVAAGVSVSAFFVSTFCAVGKASWSWPYFGA